MLVSVRQLSKKFENFSAVDAVSFDAAAGEIFGLLGPNGAGKTTTLRVIATTLRATSGTATIAGFEITRQPEEVKKHIGVLTTDIGVYERFSGRENLRYFGQLYGVSKEKLESRIEELIDLLAMREFIDRRAGKYSTGMKQKLAIARSVIHDPEVIIFDEPTSGLDVLASQTVLRFMQQVKEQGKCVILSTHQMSDAEKLCDRVAIIHQGKVVSNDYIHKIKEQTQTTSLEEAFLRLVEEQPKPPLAQSHQSGLSPMRCFAFLPSWVWRLTVLVCVGIFFAFQSWTPLAGWKPLGYVFLAIGIVVSLIDRYYLKRLR